MSTKDTFVRHMISLFRDNQVTEKRYCRADEHYSYLGKTYLTYLKNTRSQEELVKRYFHKGERSIERAAKLVGLTVPKRGRIMSRIQPNSRDRIDHRSNEKDL